MNYAKHFYLLDENNTWYEPTEIVLKEGMTEIKEYTFSGSSTLTSIKIPNSVETIGEGAFYGCSKLTSIEIPNSVETIGESAFEGCNKLTTIAIPNSVETIGKSAFYGCSKLTSIEIPNSVETIGESAFEGCNKLATIVIPKRLVSIGRSAFSDCSNLKNVYYKGKIEEWRNIEFEDYSSNPMENFTRETFLYEEFDDYSDSSVHFYLLDGNNTWYELTKMVVPDNATIICNEVFSGCSNFTSIVIPNSIKSISEGVFNNNLKNVYYKGTIKEWCNIEFEDCDSNPMNYAEHFYLLDENNTWYEPTEIILEEGITKIKEHSFYGFNQLVSITIPNSVISIGNRSFYGCSSLIKLKISENFIEEFTNYFDTEAIIKRYNEKKYRKEDGYIIFD